MRPGPAKQLAPAKLTLDLRVTGVRSDGYHLLESEMVSVDLVDELELSEGHGLEVIDRSGVAAGHAVASGSTNLVVRALELLGTQARVRLVKRIPPGAGLGGGSSDAAAVLRWGGVTQPRVAAALGADVPFCLSGGHAMVTNIGEEIRPLAFEDRSFVLLLPPLVVPTAKVYEAFDELGRPAEGRCTNDLELAALVVEPGLVAWREQLARATGREPRLAGSGAAWFVEGSLQEMGLEEGGYLEAEGQRARTVEVRTIPAFRTSPDRSVDAR